MMITAYGVEAIKSGAGDFVIKPFDPDQPALVVKKALEHPTLLFDVNS